MRGRVDFLDGIRALAIMAVLVTHYLGAVSASSFGRGGVIGVDIFFVLSGFIITSILWKASPDLSRRERYRRFVSRRFARLYPALAGLLVFGTLLVAVVPQAAPPPSDALNNALIAAVQAGWYFEAEGDLIAPFRVTWSLAVEWYFYLLWPLAIIACRDRGTAPLDFARWTLVAGLALYVIALPMSGRWFHFSPSARFGELLIGGALALALLAGGVAERRSAPVPRWGPVVAIVALVAYALLAPFELHSWATRFLAWPIGVVGTAYLIWWGYSTPQRGPVGRILTLGWVTLVGRMSYSIYLWHTVPTNLLDRDLLPQPLPVLALLGATIAAVLITASYLLLDRPFMHPRSDALTPKLAAPPGRHP